MTNQSTGEMAQLYAKVSEFQTRLGLNLIDQAAPQPGEVVLDLGCGTGDLAAQLARRVSPGGRVFAVDPDRERLNIASEAILPEQSNVEFFEGCAEDLSMIPTGSIDLVYSNYVMHWVADKMAAMGEIARCLVPGGRFVFECSAGLSPLVVEVTRMTGKPGEACLSKVTSLDEEECRELLLQCGFRIDKLETIELWETFPHLDDFLSWWEGTTHGGFKYKDIPASDYERLAARHQDETRFFICWSVRAVATTQPRES